MEELFIYFGKMIVCSAVMFGYYHLMLKNKTFHHYNRFYLLLIVVVSLLLPLLKISYFTIEVNKDLYLLLNSLQNFNSTKNITNDFPYFEFAAIAFGLVSIVLLSKLFFGIIKINKIQKQFPKEKIENIAFYNTNLENAPFSYFRNLFWKDSILLQSDLGRQILKHEMVHIEQKHSLDKIMMEAVTGILWFNPVFWFIKKEINLIHEYLADKKAVKHADTKAFAQMLLASHFSGKVLPATSPFLSSNLKKRLKMLQKPKTKFGYAHRILALPFLFVLAFAYLVNAKNTEIKETNKAIAIAIAELKTDTIKPKSQVDEMLKLNDEKLAKANEKLQKDNEKIKLLADETKKKAEELKKIQKEKGTSNPEFTAKLKEIETLGNKIDKITSNHNGLVLVDGFPIKFDDTWKSSFNTWSDDDLAKFQSKFNDKKWIDSLFINGKSIYKLEKDFNPEVFEKIKERLPKGTAFSPNLLSYLNEFSVEAAQKQAEIATKKATEAQKLAENASKNAKKDAKKTAELAKERAKIAAERAELARQQAELLKKEAELNKKDPIRKNTIIVGTKPNSPAIEYIASSTFIPNFTYSQSGKIDKIVIGTPDGKTNTYTFSNPTNLENLKIFVNGKEISREEMNKISPNNIESINVIRKNEGSPKKYNEIRINLKD